MDSPGSLHTAFAPCSGVDLKAQGPQIFVPPAMDVSGNVPSRGDLEPKAKFLLNCIAMDKQSRHKDHDSSTLCLC